MANKRLSVVIDADTSKFQKSIRGMQDSVKGATSGVSKSLGGIGGAVKGAFTGLGKVAGVMGAWKLLDGAVNMVKDSVGKAFTRIDTMEQFERVMTTMLGTTEEAQASLARITETVTGTGYGLDVASKATQRFVTGSMDIALAEETVKSWGDAVAFYGDGSNAQFQNVTDAIAKMNTKGKVEMEQLNRVIESGIPVFEILASATGQSVAQVQESLSDGSISAEEFTKIMNESFMEGTDAFDSIAGSAKEAGASWGATFDNMKAAVARGITNIIGNIDTMLQDNGLPTMREMISNFGSAFESSLTKAGNAIGPLLEKLIGLYDTITTSTAWQSMKEVIDEVIETGQRLLTEFFESATWDTINQTLKDLGQAILELDFKELIQQTGEFLDKWSPLILGIMGAITAFTILGPVITAVVGAFKGLMILKSLVSAVGLMGTAGALLAPIIGALNLPLIAVAVAIGALIAVGVLLYKNWETISAKASEIWGAITEYFSTTLESIKTYFSETWRSISTKVEEVWEGIKNYFREVWQGIVETAKSIWEPIKTFFSTLWGGVKSIFEVVWNAIKTVLTVILGLILVVVATIWNQIADSINLTLNNIKAIISVVWKAIQSVIEVAMKFIRNTIVPIWESIKSSVTNVVNSIKTVITNIWNSIKSVTTSVFNSIKSVATSVWNSIKTVIQSVVNAIKSVITTVWNSIKAILTTIMNGIKSTVSTVWNGIKTVISTIVNGVKTTVTSTFNSLKSTVSRIWNNIKSAIETPIRKAKDTVKTMIDKIKGFFNFKWSLPKLKMPRFSVSGSANPLDWLKQGVPKVNVDWFATGGIATGASVVGIGEKGSEAIVPLSQKSRMKPFAQAIASMMPQDSTGTAEKGDTIITGNTFVVREEADIKKIAHELKKLDDRESRSRGKKGVGR